MKLCEEKRGVMLPMEYLEPTRVCLHYRMPLAEMIIDFFDKMKGCSRGYASWTTSSTATTATTSSSSIS